MKHKRTIKPRNYYAVSLRFDGLGHGFAVGFDTRTAARAFALYCLLGFAEMTTRTIYTSYPWDARRYYCERSVSRFLIYRSGVFRWRRCDLPELARQAVKSAIPGAGKFAAAVNFLFTHYPQDYNLDLLLK